MDKPLQVRERAASFAVAPAAMISSFRKLFPARIHGWPMAPGSSTHGPAFAATQPVQSNPCFIVSVVRGQGCDKDLQRIAKAL